MLDASPNLLDGSRLLVVEDLPGAAEAMCSQLESAGACVLGPHLSLGAGLAAAKAEPVIDAAVLDLLLDGELVFPAADVLVGRGVPLLFVTGYRALVPSRYERAEICEKPLDPLRVVRELERMVAPPLVVAIGASGRQGVRDLKELLWWLPTGLNVILLVVVHRSWLHVSWLHEVLGLSSAAPVVLAGERTRFEVGSVYVGDPSRHLTLGTRGRNERIDDPDRAFGNRTIDLLFNSVAAKAGRRAVSVVLSGGLDDGSSGSAVIDQAGGSTLVVAPILGCDGEMPRSAIGSIGMLGKVGLVGSPAALAARIALLSRAHA